MSTSIGKRIQRIYASLGTVVETDIQSTVKYVQEGTTGRMTFDKDMSPEEIENNAHSAIALLANLPDHLKRWLREHKQSTAPLEQFTQACFELKVLKDLANTEKHGGFDRNGGHSGLFPTLHNVHRGMRLEPKAGGSKATIQIKFPEGIITHLDGEPLQVVIDADVRDSAGNVVGKLTTLLESALTQFEGLCRQIGAA
ncbi:hypothetical protein QFW80_11285 [Luteimonas sp. M1R5S18]|uniref:Uncharacterized protein n=1 Tax=Luteimonas rhizosphaericola TaxID=3042024 RepID=A0ABT6JK85_9GAMM|nr:hypothetical protein [Luteimonas rhizosphaericola]MDH5831099.1 hypothetical protein [Luteimonas rhizosphaericola]